MKRIGPYRIDGELGSGAMGLVYRAHDETLDRPVAVKLLGTALASRDWERCRREARLTASVRHPNVVGVHGAGRTRDGQAYLVLDLVEGGSLQDLISKQGKLPPRQAAKLARDLADALHAAHGQGVLHRDVKPQNVLLDSKGSPLLADFGLARGQTVGSMTVEGEVIGTPAYMSPEQACAEHDKVGQATDVYGLGATLYAMLSGRAPHEGTTTPETLQSILRASPRAVGSFVLSLDPALEAICMRCLAREPGQRFASAASLRNALDDYLFGRRSGESREALPTPRPRRTRSLAVPLVALSLGAGLGLLPWLSSGDPRMDVEARDLHRRADERRARGDDDGALQDLDVLIAERQDMPRVFFERASVKLNLEDVPGALADIERAAEFTIQDPESLHLLRAKAYHQLDDFVAAEAESDRAIALRPNMASAYMRRGLAREMQGDTEGARADYAAALERDPREVNALVRRAALALVDDDLIAAGRDVEAALEVDDEHPQAYVVRADLRTTRGDYVGALADCDAVICPLLAKGVKALQGRTAALIHLDRWQHAKSNADLTVWGDPEATEAYLLRAATLRGLGELAERAGQDATGFYRAALNDVGEYLDRATVEKDVLAAQEVQRDLGARLARIGGR